MERIKKQKSISRIFAHYIICFCLTTIVLVISSCFLFLAFIHIGIIVPANYYQKYIEQKTDEIVKTKDVKSLIPGGCRYAVYNLDGQMIEGNVSQKKSQDMWEIYKNNKFNDGYYFYKIIQRKNEICMVEYKLIGQFANSNIQKYIPYAGDLFPLLDIILFIIEIIVFSKCFSKRLSKEMKILKETTENIQMENLDFDIKYSKILEINEVLSALSKMKTELQQSLNKQWKIEETQKEQMAALAHDIKTPLTIIRGNVELLDELDLNSEQRSFAKNILNESMKMESYIRSLIEIMKSKKEIMIEKKEIDSQVFIQTIEAVAGSITMEKSIKFIMNVKEIPQKFVADEELIQRAIVNVISNAIDYTPINGQILFEVDTNNAYIRFIVEDSGRGFTKEELKYATEQFFQGDKSRNSKLHYGMGLYIVKESLKQLKGNICLENSKETGGAKVSLEIPID